MFRHRLEDYNFRVSFDWMLMAFLAGSINAGGYLACQRFVTHLTGFATLAGIDVATGKMDAAIGIATVPLFFLIGVMVSAYFIDRNISNGKRPNYSMVMALIFLSLMAATLGGYFGFFGEFGDPVKLQRDYLFIALLCMASGLQNASISSASESTVRTTHLTGITTDLGIGLVRFWNHTLHGETAAKESRANWLRVSTIASFATGSGVGALVFLRCGYLGFLLPAAISVYAFFVAIFSTAAQKLDT